MTAEMIGYIVLEKNPASGAWETADDEILRDMAEVEDTIEMLTEHYKGWRERVLGYAEVHKIEED